MRARTTIDPRLLEMAHRPLALLAWHDSGWRGRPDLTRPLPCDDVDGWLPGRHRVLVPCTPTRRCLVEFDAHDLRYVDHPNRDAGVEAVATTLGAEAESCTVATTPERRPRNVWPWEAPDRRERKGALDPHLGALIVARLLLAWAAKGAGVEAWGRIRFGQGPRSAAGVVTPRLGPYDEREAPTQRPPWLGWGYPIGPWCSRPGMPEKLHASRRERTACAACWTYGIVDDARELCEPCSGLLHPASACANARERACATVNAMLAGAQ